MSEQSVRNQDLSMLSKEEIYLRIWEKQQDTMHARWTSITFFLTLSFALFGLSLQDPNISISGTIQRFVAIMLYWFSYLIYRQYSEWGSFLRDYLRELEGSPSVQITLQGSWNSYKKTSQKFLSINRLLILFGLLYTATAFLLLLFKIQ